MALSETYSTPTRVRPERTSRMSYMLRVEPEGEEGVVSTA